MLWSFWAGNLLQLKRYNLIFILKRNLSWPTPARSNYSFLNCIWIPISHCVTLVVPQLVSLFYCRYESSSLDRFSHDYSWNSGHWLNLARIVVITQGNKIFHSSLFIWVIHVFLFWDVCSFNHIVIFIWRLVIFPALVRSICESISIIFGRLLVFPILMDSIF